MMATHFSSLDWVIVVVYVLATFGTGLYGRKFVGGIADFLVAGRELGTFIGIATLAATEIGTITFMYYAELGYKTGYASFINGLIAGVVMIVIGRTGFIVKRLRAMKLMTVPEFFPGDGGRSGGDGWVLLLQDAGKLRGARSVLAGGGGDADRVADGAAGTTAGGRGDGAGMRSNAVSRTGGAGARRRRAASLRTIAALALGAATIAPLAGQETPVYFAPEPGAARVEASGSGFAISNAVVAASWRISGRKLGASEFRDLIDGRTIAGPANPFVLIVGSDRAVTPAEMEVTSGPTASEVAANPEASRLSERVAGKAVVMKFHDAKESLDVTWRVILRDGSNYIRSEMTVAADRDVPINEIRMIDWELPGAHVDGTVHGSPVVDGTIFVGFEHPLSECEVALGRARCELERELPLKKGHEVTYTSVAGVTAPGQLRRGFLHYVERERAHPYRTFLHYNSWYDLGFFNRYDEKQALNVVRAFGTELVEKRGVKMSSFLFDDGWDNPSTLWQFNPGFPHGLTAVRAEAEKYGAEPGIWMSPWGGYSEPKRQRVAAARAGGYEIVDNGLALSGPKYYALFRDTCLRMMREYGVNQFKFDGTGNANRVFPGSQFDSDFDAAINLIGELRAQKRDLYVNLTTGTYPSPFWLMYADSIWRGGDDDDFLGVGTDRERWITYRDADTYEHVVMDGPLYPLNSLMLHGLIFARYAKRLDSDPGRDFKNEVRDYFGTGTQLQEMYITPALLSPEDWDTLAETAKWSRANADILVDTHWIGGDPAQLEAYGWASWAPRKGILVLRNPSDRAQSVLIDVAKIFELPTGAATEFQLRSPWKEDAGQVAVTLRAGEAHEFQLKPFEVKVLDAMPVNQ